MVARIEHVTEDGIEKRHCGKCKLFKPLTSFGYSKATWDKCRPTCKDCLHVWNMQNREARTNYNKEYWQKTKEDQTEKNKKWRLENPEKVKECMKEWLIRNKDHKASKDREYRLANYERYKENHREWRSKQYARLREEAGEEFSKIQLKNNIGRRIREILGQKKSERCAYYVGCSLEDLRAHLESTFADGMSWDNYGQWHIDHVFPCASFDITDETERKACFHYTNLQALWASDNIRKKDSCDMFKKDAYVATFR